MVNREDKYYIIEEVMLDGRKTPVYVITSKLSNDVIGTIKWYGAWRKFCFYPNENTIWDQECLLSLQAHMQDINYQYRLKKKEERKNNG